MRGGRQARGGTGLAAALLMSAFPVMAQEEPPLRFTVTLGGGLSVEDNADLVADPAGTTAIADTRLRFAFESATRSSRLSLSVPLSLEARREGNGATETQILVPDATVTYTRDGANSTFTASGSYSVRRLDGDVLTFVDEDLNPVDLILDGGELRRVVARTGLSAGLDGPLGANASLFIDNRDYIDTTDPELYDRIRYGMDAGLRLRFSDVLTGRVTGSLERFDADDIPQTEESTVSLGAGADYEVSPVTTVSASVSFTTVERTEFGISETIEEGWGFTLGATRALPTGAIRGSLSRTVNSAGVRTVLSFGQTLDLPRGALSYSLGYSVPEDGEESIVGDLAYRQDLPTGAITASISQSATANDEDEDTLVTRVALGLSRDINSVSGLNVTFGLGRSESLAPGGSDLTTRADLGVSYRRALTEEWDWSLGYQARYSKEDGGDARNSNRLFTRIDRRFSIRP